MSIKDRLAKKTQDLVYPAKGEGIIGPNPLRTGPGQMLMVNSLMRESNEKVALLEERLKQFEGGLPVMLLDPAQVVPSKWANRVAQSFEGADFELLRSDIAAASGNVQPIKVRPLVGKEGRYEIVFGHRRHRACLELNLPVMSMVEEVSDAELFMQMDRENRARADLSPWEQGRMYLQALEDKLFSSRENLSREVGIDAGNLSKALRLASLDRSIVAAFPSPVDLQFRWAKPLTDAFANDRERVEGVLREVAAHNSAKRSPKEIYAMLIGLEGDAPRIEEVRKGKKLIAEVHAAGDRVTIKFAAGLLSPEALGRLQGFLGSDMFD